MAVCQNHSHVTADSQSAAATSSDGQRCGRDKIQTAQKRAEKARALNTHNQ